MDVLYLQAIRVVVRDIEQSAREILTLLQTVHQTDGIKSGIVHTTKYSLKLYNSNFDFLK